jgi:hypothetical protein
MPATTPDRLWSNRVCTDLLKILVTLGYLDVGIFPAGCSRVSVRWPSVPHVSRLARVRTSLQVPGQASC